ncbi:MAG: radical SAM protein [Thermodesulfobacteriota bacterium]|nr:radical SAM protein [Thermodesulfobacteriota bacterium]
MIKDQDKDEFLRITQEKYYKAVAQCKPLFAWFSLTDVCNLDCKYCFAEAKYHPPGTDDPIIHELSTKEVYDIIDNIYEAGTEIVMFAGGEPTLREDLVDIVKYTSRRMSVAMNSNGFILDERLCKDLAWAGLSQVKVSVDGMCENHDYNRGDGSFAKTMDALRNLVIAGIPKVMLIMTLSSLNYTELEKMVDLSMSMGVDFTMVEFLPLGKASERKDWALTKEQIEKAQRYLVDAQQHYGWERIAFENRYIVAEDEFCKRVCGDPNMPCGFYDFCVGCITGIYSYCITASGKVVTGDIMTLEIGDLKKERLKDIWRNNETLKLIRNRENLKGKCGKCDYRYICGGCRRRAYTYTNDIMASDPGCWRNAGKN